VESANIMASTGAMAVSLVLSAMFAIVGVYLLLACEKVGTAGGSTAQRAQSIPPSVNATPAGAPPANCNAGHHLVGKKCVGWAGSCANGTLIAQQQRAQDHHCGSCNSGYFLTGTNNCNKWNVCSNGEYVQVKGSGIKDRVCAAHAQCNANQYESKAPTASSDRECKGAGSCSNGALIVQTNRTQANHCGSCNSGYHLLNKTCVRWAGSCANGTLIAQQQRAQDHHCGSCNSGYRLVGKSCLGTGMPTSCCNLYCDDAGGSCKADSKIIAGGGAPERFPGTRNGVDGHRVYIGSTYTIHWQANPSNTSVKISLVYAGQQSVVLAASSNGGSNNRQWFQGNGFKWKIGQGLNSTDCRLKVQSLSNPTLTNVSKTFVIQPGIKNSGSGRRLAETVRLTSGTPSPIASTTQKVHVRRLQTTGDCKDSDVVLGLVFLMLAILCDGFARLA
jgi:hypothetical protein